MPPKSKCDSNEKETFEQLSKSDEFISKSSEEEIATFINQRQKIKISNNFQIEEVDTLSESRKQMENKYLA